MKASERARKVWREPMQGQPGTTPINLVRIVMPEASDEECDYLLWEQSSFPFGEINHWFRQVREAVAGHYGRNRSVER